MQKKKKLDEEKKIQYLKKLAEKQRVVKEKKVITKEKKVKTSPKKVKKDKGQGGPMGDDDLNFANKDHLVEELSVRWNYALPRWPPDNYCYDAALRAHGLRKVDAKGWKLEPEEVDGLVKVYELETFPGYFKDSRGRTYDLRPAEGKPTLNNFLRMDLHRLQQLLYKAYEG